MDRGVCVSDDSSSSRQHEHHLLQEALPDFSASTETRKAPPLGASCLPPSARSAFQLCAPHALCLSVRAFTPGDRASPRGVACPCMYCAQCLAQG